MAMFERAEHVNVYGGSFVANAGGPSKGLNKLIKVVATNAILNAGGRADEVRCYPGTREEVIGKLEKFMDDESPDRKRMMWLSGPAGAGKSAICQTVAERRKEQAANFFFFRGDRTRSDSKPLVATLVYQLRRFYPALDKPISDCLAKDPLICSASIEAQFQQLISSPIETIHQPIPIQQPIIIIIDGLDECSNDEREQDQILVALHRLAHADDSPFRVLVSSRVEPQLIMSFNHLGSPVESIFLNEDYKPQEDIRRFVVAKFAEIKKGHHLAQTLDKNWPTPADIDAIVKKSSGQFIYSATVMRHIQFSSEHPALSLSIVLEMPPTTNRNPLAHIDAVYSYIFSKVHDIQAVNLILLARKCTRPYGMAFIELLELVGYQGIHVQSIFSDLAAIIKVVPYDGSTYVLEFYHASLEDYLNDKSRSTIYYVNENEIAAKLSSVCLRNIHDAHSILLAIKPLGRVQKSTPELTQSLLDASTRHFSDYHTATFENLIGHITRLYWKDDKDQCKVLWQNWNRLIRISEEWTSSRVEPKDPLVSQHYKQFWMTEGYSGPESPTPPDSAPAGMAKSHTQTAQAVASPSGPIGGVHVPRASSRNVIAAPPKGKGVDYMPTGVARTDPQPTAARVSPNAAIVTGICKAGPPPQNVPAASPKERMGNSLMSQRGSTSHAIDTSRKGAEAVSDGRVRRGRLRKKHTGDSFVINSANPGSSSMAQQLAAGMLHGSREYNDRPHKHSVVRVKLYYQDDIRSMALTPDSAFSEFVDKVTAKLFKNIDDLTLKFKDRDSDMITLRDSDDYDHAVETACQSSKGQAEVKLEIWCWDRIR